MKNKIIKSLPTSAAIIAMTCTSILAPAVAFATPHLTGTLGTSSSAYVDIQVDKPAQARITGMTDLSLPSWVIGDGDKELFTNVCIYSTSGAYTVVATGSGTANAFTLTDGLGSSTLHVTPYTVQWNDAGVGAIGTGGTALTAAAAPAAFTHASVDSADCTGGVAPGKNARINVDFLGADLLKLASGTFTGTLTLLVAPN